MSFFKENVNVSELVDEMETHAAGIGKIIYLPALNSLSPDSNLFDILEFLDEPNINELDKQFSGFKLAYDSYKKCSYSDREDWACEFIDDLRQNCKFPFLVEVKLCQSINSVNFDDENPDEISGFNGSMGSSSKYLIFTDSMEDAIKQASKLGEANLLEHHQQLA